jgi:hypothetical protein
MVREEDAGIGSHAGEVKGLFTKSMRDAFLKLVQEMRIPQGGAIDAHAVG